MQLRIEYKGHFLKLAPGQTIELERNSPFFFVDQYLAEVSTPLTVVYSEINAQLLGAHFFDGLSQKKERFEVNIYDGSTFRYTATLVLEANSTSLRYAGKSTASGYLLVGISRFNSVLQNKQLRALNLGGERLFTAATIWAHVNSTANFGTDTHTFPPMRNDTLYGDIENAPDWMNKPAFATMYDETQLLVFPAVKLKYLLEQIFVEHGWRVDFSGINDTDWEFIVMVGFHGVATIANPFNLSAPIVLKLADAMPQEVTCSNLIIALCNRWGWVPMIDNQRRLCKFTALKEAGKKTPKDWTAYIRGNKTNQYSDESRTYSFKNSFGGNDALPGNPDLQGYDTTLKVANKFSLPTPSAAYDRHRIYARAENQWYGITNNENTNLPEWYPVSDGIYNVEESKSNTNFETQATPLPNYWSDINNNPKQLFVPRCSQPFAKHWGIRLLFYNGNAPTRDVLTNVFDTNTTYVYYSALCNLPNGTVVRAWSNVYEHPLVSGEDRGIIKYWFERWMKLTSSTEDITQQLELPLHEFIGFEWDDVILLNHQPYMVKSMVERVPYKGVVQCKLQRINLSSSVVNSGNSGGNSGTIYLRVEMVVDNTLPSTDVQTDIFGNVTTLSNIIWQRGYIRAYSDAAATQPLAVSNLQVLLQSNFFKDNAHYNGSPTVNTVTMNGTSYDITSGFAFPMSYNQVTDTSGSSNPSVAPPDGAYSTTYVLQNNNNLYQII